MRALRIIPNLRVPDIEATKGFYTDFLGLGTEEFNMGWVALLNTAPSTPARTSSSSRVTRPHRRTRSCRCGPTTSTLPSRRPAGPRLRDRAPAELPSCGVMTRSLVRAPDGNVVNVLNHRD